MNWPLSRNVRLENERIESSDAQRQMRTAAAILQRFNSQPGVILADEVGMGKTYVALAVAVSVIEATNGKRPVVVMIPPSVREKWPREWDVFREMCMPGGTKIRATQESITRGSEFLKLLDDPDSRRNHLIFLTHGALTSSLTDPYIRLAIVRQAMSRRSTLARHRAALPRWGRKLFGWELRRPELVAALLRDHPSSWRRTIERVTGVAQDDDPVPAAILGALRGVDLVPLAATLSPVPLRSGSNLDARLKAVRREMSSALRELWADALAQLDVRLPLLIMDEAHHLKNRWTRLAGLFANEEAKEDAEAVSTTGPLGKVFDRMLFLTATPFQLGHHELLEVLRRFEGVRWKSRYDRDTFRSELAQLERALDASQTAALRLDRAWSRLTPNDLSGLEEAWWKRDPALLRDLPRAISLHITDVESQLRSSERLLRPWVIRHARPDRDERRRVLPGRAILDDSPDGTGGLQVGERVVLPFLLAARAQALVASMSLEEGSPARAFFAEGLASSFEAYRQTRQRSPSDAMDMDARPSSLDGADLVSKWYLTQLDKALPPADEGIWGEHPKISAVVKRVVELWRRGEKSVVFCFYIETGKALRSHISRALYEEFVRWGTERLALREPDENAVMGRLRLVGERFFDPKSPVRRAAEPAIRDILHGIGMEDPAILERAADVTMRFLRTRSFLLRHMDIAAPDQAKAFTAALDVADASSFTLEQKIASFGKFLIDRVDAEREELLLALEAMHTGDIHATTEADLDPSERSTRREGPVLPNVRLANGQVARDIRRRLMLAFNTPFFPEILVASAVMSEGVDLHLYCRHAIHHDLDWNPSVLEQRTGRLDRLGSHAWRSSMPIVVYEPFLEATQDEKQYRVVKDRERWFNVVMGEKLEIDEASTDRIAERAPLPSRLARELSLRLEVIGT
jgi:broad specificity phosphatase PhoE